MRTERNKHVCEVPEGPNIPEGKCTQQVSTVPLFYRKTARCAPSF